MKDKIFEIIKCGNNLLNKGTFLFGLRIKSEHVEKYNLKLRELKSLNNQLNKEIKEIKEFEIISFNELVSREKENPPDISSKLIFAYWTGDIFLSKQTLIKTYIKSINMTLDLILHKIYKMPEYNN